MEFLRFRPQWLRDSGTGAINVELDPEVNFMLHEVRLTLEAQGGVGAGSFTITLESGAGTPFNLFQTLLAEQNMENEDTFIFRPIAEQRILFEEGDALKFEWPNGAVASKAYALEIIWSPIY